MSADPKQFVENVNEVADSTAQVKGVLTNKVQVHAGNIKLQMHQLREPTVLTLRKAGMFADLGLEGKSFARQFLDPPVGTQPWQGDCDCGITFQDVSIRANHTAGCGISEREAYSAEVWKAVEDATEDIEEEEEDPDKMPDHFDINLSMRSQIDPRRDRTVCGTQWRSDEERVVCVPAKRPYDADSSGYSVKITSLFKNPINALE